MNQSQWAYQVTANTNLANEYKEFLSHKRGGGGVRGGGAKRAELLLIKQLFLLLFVIYHINPCFRLKATVALSKVSHLVL